MYYSKLKTVISKKDHTRSFNSLFPG